MLVDFILSAHLAGFQATLADFISLWREDGEFSSTLAGLSKNILENYSK
jgi:hypothetical protein